MKAIVQDEYGSADVLRFEDVETPVAGRGEVLIRVIAASALIGDWHVMTGTASSRTTPKIPSAESAPPPVAAPLSLFAIDNLPHRAPHPVRLSRSPLPPSRCERPAQMNRTSRLRSF